MLYRGLFRGYTGDYLGVIQGILGICWGSRGDNGQENGNYQSGLRVIRRVYRGFCFLGGRSLLQGINEFKV